MINNTDDDALAFELDGDDGFLDFDYDDLKL